MAKNTKKARHVSQPQPETQEVTQERPIEIDNGDETRGPVNSRENQTSTQPEPGPAIEAIGTDETAAKVAQLRPAGSKSNVFDMASTALSRGAAIKMQHLGEARQKLAEARDYANRGDEFAAEAEETAAAAIVTLYQDRTAGILSNEELNGILGDIFGYKPKKDGTPGKTPKGLGERIRKRTVRLTQAHHYANADDGEETSRFFDGMDKDDVIQILAEVEQGDLTPWKAYNDLSELKGKGTRVNPAFDPKAVAKMAAALQEAGAVEKLANNPGLLAAYGNLRNTMRVIGEAAMPLMSDETREALERLAA